MAVKRILIATPLYPPQVGGPATRAKILEEQLPARGIVVQLAKFHWVLWLPRLIRHIVYAAIVFVMSIGTDRILSLDAASVGWPVSLISKCSNVPFDVIWVGNAAWERGTAQFGLTDTLERFIERKDEELSPRLATFRKKEKEILLAARKVVVPSIYLKKIAVVLGVPVEKISVIYNSFEPVEIKESREELRKKFGWNKKVVMSAGRDVSWKGFGMLREVMKEIPEAELFITHTLPKQELLERIKAADLFVLNTGYEGLSHQLIEVMSIGTPIVTTNVGGNPELIEDGKDGILVEYNDHEALKKSIMVLWKKPEYLAELAKNAKEKVSQFTVERMVNELVAIL